MAWRLLRSALLGAAIGLVLLVVLELTGEETNLGVVIASAVLLLGGLGLRRWLQLRQDQQRGRHDREPR